MLFSFSYSRQSLANTRLRMAMLLLSAYSALAMAGPAQAAGDLLVAPTRIILDGQRGTEVILSNTGKEEATYRVSLELKRMTPEGRLELVEVASATEQEKTSLGLVRFAPKRVTLLPDQPQSIRLGLQGTDALPDGEYRAHMLFRAMPKVEPAAAAAPSEGLKIQLNAIYGISIPVIVRKGKLEVTAALANARMVREKDGTALTFDISRKGNRSVYGDIVVTAPSEAEPLMVARGIAVYPELQGRSVTLDLDDTEIAKMHGRVTISYREPEEKGGATIAELQTVLP